MTDPIDKLRDIIEASNNIVFFGGAGVSTESGIPDFRSADGLYNQKYAYPPETMLSRSFFYKHTSEFYRFYREKMVYPDAKPNKAHIALAKWEAEGKLKAIVTQNVDGLHTEAGSVNVFELHGCIHRNFCLDCGKPFELEAIMGAKDIPQCDKCGGIVKPDVVLYEEGLDPNVMSGATSAIHNADVLIVGGTSLNVYPAAGLVDYYRKGKLVLINKSATSYDRYANILIRDPIGETLAACRDDM